MPQLSFAGFLASFFSLEIWCKPQRAQIANSCAHTHILARKQPLSRALSDAIARFQVTSIQALKFVNVPTFFVFRTSCSVLSSGVDLLCFGTKTSAAAMGWLFVIVFGAVLYASNDLQFSSQGYLWSFADIISMAIYLTLVKGISSSAEPIPPTLNDPNLCLLFKERSFKDKRKKDR